MASKLPLVPRSFPHQKLCYTLSRVIWSANLLQSKGDLSLGTNSATGTTKTPFSIPQPCTIPCWLRALRCCGCCWIPSLSTREKPLSLASCKAAVLVLLAHAHRLLCRSLLGRPQHLCPQGHTCSPMRSWGSDEVLQRDLSKSLGCRCLWRSQLQTLLSWLCRHCLEARIKPHRKWCICSEQVQL